MTRTQSCCKWSFGGKHPIITSIVVCSGPLHLKSRIFALGVLRDNIIMQGIKRWADVRVWLSPVHKHLILQRWDQSRDCAQQGHKHILCKCAKAPCYSALMCKRALTEATKRPFCARPSKSFAPWIKAKVALATVSYAFAVKKGRACGSAECKPRPLYQWDKSDKKWQE